MSRRILTLATSGTLLVVLAAVAALLPVPYVALTPGPVTNTLGEVGGKELIVIEGRKSYPDEGNLDLTTVSVLGGPGSRMDLFTALRGWVDDSVAVVPEERIFPEGQTAKQSRQRSRLEMRDSQQSATTAALRHLGIPVTATVEVFRVPKDSPSRDLLRKGDVLVSVDGKAVTGGASLRTFITKHEPGDELRIAVRRDGEPVEVTVRTRAAEDGRTIVGILTKDHVQYPFTVEIQLKRVGGPSAGLMFALGIVDKLTPGSLTGGEHIAGTGTIDDAGLIGPIGGVPQKMVAAKEAGATVFLVPPGNCREALRTVPEGLKLVRAKSLSSAVRSLDRLRADDSARVPSC